MLGMKKSDRSRSGGPAKAGPSRWAIAGLAAIAILALVLFTWGLSRNGMANSYYAAAAKSATLSWKAFFFGSLDPGSFITVDKPPVALWVMALSGRIFGFSSWSMLMPQALAGVASILVLHRLVRLWRGEAAALLAALALAVTPVAVLIFRYNNPDAFLTLLLLLAAWATWSAVKTGSTWRLSLAGVALGFAFLTKMLMAFMVLPALAIVYLLFGPPRLGRRVVQLLVAVAAMLISGGWWVAVVELWPDSSRPHVGGTLGDSWVDLIFSRSAGVLDTAARGSNLSGQPGWWRIFNDQLGGQIAWLLPLALAGLLCGLVVSRHESRAGKTRAGYAMWGLWTLVIIAVFSGAQGTLHSYYTVVLAPGVAALAGAGLVELWYLGARDRRLSWLLPAVVAGSAVWSAILLGRVTGYAAGLSVAVLGVGALSAIGVLVAFLMPAGLAGWVRRLVGVVVVGLSVAALLAGPFAYSLSTIARSVTGNTAAAGPSASGSNSSGSAIDVDEALVAYLLDGRGRAEYLVAVQSAEQSVPIILATGEPVVTIGGYKSRDPVPTVAEFERMVATGLVRHVLLTSSSGSTSASSSAALSQSSGGSAETLQAVVDWVVANGAVVQSTEYGGSSEGTLYYVGSRAR